METSLGFSRTNPSQKKPWKSPIKEDHRGKVSVKRRMKNPAAPVSWDNRTLRNSQGTRSGRASRKASPPKMRVMI